MGRGDDVSVNRNWNLFAGDAEYKSNFALQFRTPYTFDRFRQDKFLRLRLPIRAFLGVCLCLWLYAYCCTTALNVVVWLVGLVAIGVGFYVGTVKRSWLGLRMALVWIEFWSQNATFSLSLEYGLMMHLLLFNVPTIIAGKQKLNVTRCTNHICVAPPSRYIVSLHGSSLLNDQQAELSGCGIRVSCDRGLDSVLRLR